MNSTVIVVDRVKDVLQVAIATRSGKILEHLRLNRTQFQHLLVKRDPAVLLFEACGTAHHWGEWSQSAVTPYVSCLPNTSPHTDSATRLTERIPRL